MAVRELAGGFLLLAGWETCPAAWRVYFRLDFFAPDFFLAEAVFFLAGFAALAVDFCLPFPNASSQLSE